MRYVKFFKSQLQNFINGVSDEQAARSTIPLHSRPHRKASTVDQTYADNEIFDDLATPQVAERYTQEDLKDFLNLYSTHTWTYRCVNTIATAAANVDFVFKQGKKIVDQDEVGGWLKQPNFFMTWYDLFETMWLHCELAGNSFWEIQRNPAGKVVNIFPLRPDRIEIVPDPKKRILKYRYNVNGTFIDYEPEEIIHFKYTDAKAEFWGISAASAARTTTTIDFYAVAWNKEFFQRGAEPGAVLESPETLTDLAYNRIMKVWNKRHRGKPHEIALLEEGMKYHQITSSHSDMQYLEGRAKNVNEIGGVYNVPPFYLNQEGGGPPNEQKKRFYQTNIIPKVTKFEKFLNAFLFEAEGYKIDFLTKSLPMIIEDEEIKSRIAQSNVTHGIWTQNEARRIEWDMEPKPWGDTWHQPVGLFDTLKPELRPVAGGMAGDEKKPGEKPPGDMPGNANVTSARAAGTHPSQVRAPREKADTGLTPISKMEMAEPRWDIAEEVDDWTEYMFWKQAAGPDEMVLRAQLAEFFEGQGERVLPRLAHNWPIHKADEGLSAEERRSIVETILKLLMDEKAEQGAMRSFMTPTAESMISKHGQVLLNTHGVSVPFVHTAPEVKQFMQDFTASQVRHITSTTREILKTQLLKAAEEGESIKAVLGRIRDVFSGDIAVQRAQKIARTELVTMSNGGRYLAAKQSGVFTKKRWVSEKLATTRKEPGGANHLVMHGIEKGMDEPFECSNRKGGVDLMLFPGADEGSAENVCNCVCVLRYKRTNAFDRLFDEKPTGAAGAVA